MCSSGTEEQLPSSDIVAKLWSLSSHHLLSFFLHAHSDSFMNFLVHDNHSLKLENYGCYSLLEKLQLETRCKLWFLMIFSSSLEAGYGQW